MTEDLSNLPSLEEAKARAREFVARRKLTGGNALQRYEDVVKSLLAGAEDEIDGDYSLANLKRDAGSSFEV